MQNALIESASASARFECLAQHWFLDLDDAIQPVEDWRREYNEVSLHSATGDRPPTELIHKPSRPGKASTGPAILI